MAGNARPRAANIGEEAHFKLLSGSGSNGQTGKGLFDSRQVNEWNTDGVFYWSKTGEFVEIEIISPVVNIWRSGTESWASYNSPLKISKWSGSSYIDVTNSYPQTITNINQTRWEKTISRLPSSRYKFERGAGYRMDSEWYIEDASLRKFLIASDTTSLIIYPMLSENIIPIMTSNSTPSGVASASGEFSRDNAAWKAFDGDIETRWANSDRNAAWVAYEFEEKKTIGKYAIQCFAQKSIDWTFDAFDETTNMWITLHSVRDAIWSTDLEKKSFIINNKKAFKKYRIYTTKTESYGPSISTFEMMEVIPIPVIPLSSTKINDLERYGLDRGANIDLGAEINNRSYIKSDSSVLGDGKVFKHKIDTSKIPIKKVSIE